MSWETICDGCGIVIEGVIPFTLTIPLTGGIGGRKAADLHSWQCLVTYVKDESKKAASGLSKEALQGLI